MRNDLLYLITFLTISACNIPQKTSSKFSAPGPGKYIEWFGNNDMANEFAMITLTQTTGRRWQYGFILPW